MQKLQKIIIRSFNSRSPLNIFIGKAPIYIPNGVKLSTIDKPLTNEPKHYNTSTLKVEGPLGKSELAIHKYINLTYSKRERELDDGFNFGDQVLNVSIQDDQDKKQRAMWGTTRTLISNMIEGTTEGYNVPLKLVGVGYRALIEKYEGKDCVSLKVGYTHPIYIPIPDGIKVTIPSPNRILLFGIDKQDIYQFASKIRAWRKPEPYKLKGIFVGDETIKKKEIKKK